jgi:serine protease Do
VPIKMARRVMEQLVQNGEVRRGQIGVSVRDFDAERAASENYQGAVIADIVGGSPAEKAGLRKGDIVKAVDSTSIRSAAQLRNLIGLMPLGSRVSLRLERNGNPISASVDVGPARASAPQHAGN